MSVEVGFDSFFRPGFWTPVRVDLRNNGESVVGRLVIRPETSGTVVGNAFSTAIDLPGGAQKSATINIQARSFPDSIRVELIDDEGFIRATQQASLFDVQPFDHLIAVVSAPNRALPNLAGVHIGGSHAEQALWAAHELPEDAQSLQALNMILLIDIDSDSLSAGQQLALRRWLRSGGHLIVAGGPTAQSSARGLLDILPLRPEGSRAIDEVSAYARFSDDYRSALSERSFIATGSLHEDAQVLAEQDGIPLLMRRTFGAGGNRLSGVGCHAGTAGQLARADGLVPQTGSHARTASDLAARLHPSGMGRRGCGQSTWRRFAAAAADTLRIPGALRGSDRPAQLFHPVPIQSQWLGLVHHSAGDNRLHRNRLDGRIQFARRRDHRQSAQRRAILHG